MTPRPVPAPSGIEERSPRASNVVLKSGGKRLAPRMQDCKESWHSSWSSRSRDEEGSRRSEFRVDRRVASMEQR